MVSLVYSGHDCSLATVLVKFWFIISCAQMCVYNCTLFKKNTHTHWCFCSTPISSINTTYWVCRQKLQTEVDKRRGSSSLLLAVSQHVTSPGDLKEWETTKRKQWHMMTKSPSLTIVFTGTVSAVGYSWVVNMWLTCYSKLGVHMGSNYVFKLPWWPSQCW